HPLFQICLGLETGGVPRLALPELPVATVAGTGNGAAKFDLEFLLRSDDGRRLHGSLLYAAELFDPETVRRTAALLGRVLDQVLTDPGLRLSDLEVLTVE
ncbi:hypothetical protein, partial [Streptomyces cinereoruber]